jgi:hypothetical protein
MVTGRQCEGYLCRLYAYQASLMLCYQSDLLQGLVDHSFTLANAWAQKPRFKAVREHLQELQVIEPAPAPAFPPASPGDDVLPPQYLQTQEEVWHQVQELISMSRQWDSVVPEKWKVRLGQGYFKSPDEFRLQAKDAWLQEFLAWADCCCEEGYGLFLWY